MAYHSPFDFEYWFVNVLAGDITIFLGLAFLTIAGLSAYFRMPAIVTGMMFAVFVIMFGFIAGEWVILVIIALAFAVFYSLAKLFR